MVEYVNRLPLRLKLNRELSISKYLLKHIALKKCGPEMYDPILRSKLGMPSSGFNYLVRFATLCDNVIVDDFARPHPYRDFFCGVKQDGQIRGKAGLLLFDLFCHFFMEHRGIPPASFSFRQFMKDRMMREQWPWLQFEEGRALEAYAAD